MVQMSPVTRGISTSISSIMAPYNFATAGLNPSTEGWLSAAPASHPAVDGGHPGVQLFHNVILHLSSEY